MNKDEIQQTKALIKLKCIKRIIDILQDLNLLENEGDMKQYNIILDYINEKDFTTFTIKILTSDKTLFDFNFKLKDENTGFAIFKSIREYFVMKNDLQYPSFQKKYDNDETNYEYHQIKTNHNVDLYSMIHSKKDEQKLEKFNQKICDKYKSFIRKVHKVNYDKDKRQILKANKKKELTFAIIDMLNELMSINSFNKNKYEILVDYQSYSTFHKFKFQILKNNKSIPFNINFKLHSKKTGTEILNDIVNYYIENYDIHFDSYDKNVTSNNKRDYVIIGKSGVNINYRIPEEYFNETLKRFRNTMDNRKQSKTLEKVK